MRLIILFFDLQVNFPDWRETLANILHALAELRLWYDRNLVRDLPQRSPLLLLLHHFVLDVVVFLNVWVKSVLYFVLWSTRQLFTDLRPLAANFCVQLDYLSVLLIRPVFTLYFRVQLVDEPFSDLFPSFGTDHFRQQLPVLTHFLYHFFYGLIFLRRPYFSIYSKLGQTSISMKALVFVTISHHGCNICPLFRVFIIQLNQLIILFGAPCFYFSLFAVSVFMLNFQLYFFTVCSWYCYNIRSFHFFYFLSL